MTEQQTQLWIGWDTGAWKTTQNDGLCLLVDKPQQRLFSAHGGIGQLIHECSTFNVFLERVIELVGGRLRVSDCNPIIIAIDAPFGFPMAIRLLIDGEEAENFESSTLDHPYLFRRTERAIYTDLQRNPLSSIQDRIGSQTTKAMHFLRKFKFENEERGFWRHVTQAGVSVTAIETYPALCKVRSQQQLRPDWFEGQFETLRHQLSSSDNSDEKDALICALIARAFAEMRTELRAPNFEEDTFDPQEGWIWYPRFAPRVV